MNGHVFQLPFKRKIRDQFKETMEALRFYASAEYKTDLNYLKPVFKNLSTPVLKMPVKPKATTRTEADGSTTLVDPSEEIKRFADDKERLRSTVRGYNVVWGQTSEL